MIELRAGILNMRKSEVFCLLFAILFSLVVFIHLYGDSFHYDEQSYIQFASAMNDKGIAVLHPYSNMRTYAYPYFLYILQKIKLTFHLPGTFDRAYIFFAQLLIYLFTCLYVRVRIRRLLSPKYGTIIFCALMLNIFNLVYLPFALTEILSISVILLYLLIMIEVLHKLFVSNNPIKWTQLFGIGLFGGLTVMVRPGNITLLGMIVIPIYLVLSFHYRPFAIRAVGLIIGGLITALLPQVILNFIHFHSLSPLPVEDLGTLQLMEGWQYIKYATAIIPGQASKIYYLNPYFTSSIDDSLHHHLLPVIINHISHPIHFVTSSILHIFALLDQDLIVPYNKCLHPWYRWITSATSHIISSVGIIGIIYCLRGSKVRRNATNAQGIVVLLLIAFIALYCLIYSQSAVETRFALPLITVLSFFVVSGYRFLTDREISPATRGIVLGCLVLYNVAALFVSHFIEMNSPLLIKTSSLFVEQLSRAV